MEFQRFVDYLARLEATSKRNEMIAILAELFQETGADEIAQIVYLCQERLVPLFEAVEFGIGEANAAEALTKAVAGDDLFLAAKKAEIKRLYKELGDYGLVAERVLPPAGRGLTVNQVYQQLYAVATAAGEGAIERKTSLLADLLQSLSGREARYLLRIPLGRLRLGIGDPTMMDAFSFALAGDKSLRPVIERAYNVCSDLGYVARLIWERKTAYATRQPEELIAVLEQVKVQPGKPVRMALAERAKSADEIIERMGTAALEGKYDGFRCQVHKAGDRIRIFSRNLEETTAMFPDLLAGVRAQVPHESIIFEGEALAYDPDTDTFLPFQETAQRKRKYDVDKMAEQLPLRLVAFDILYLDGQDCTHEPYTTRRRLLQRAIAPGDVLHIAENLITADPKMVDRFFNEKVSSGLEGIMAKRLDSPYQAGARNFNWIKLKRSYQGHLADTVDVVLVGYYRGRGKRTAFGAGALLSAVYDPANDRFLTIAKIGTGLSDEEWTQITTILDGVAMAEKPARVEAELVPDVWCEPKYVVVLQADEITRSPMHTCGRDADGIGYALRFPRVVGFIRDDKSPEDVTTEAEILSMYQKQSREPVGE